MAEESAPRFPGVLKPTVPALIVSGPVNGFAPVSVRLAAPDFVRPPLPEIEPPMVSAAGVKICASVAPKPSAGEMVATLVLRSAPLVMFNEPVPAMEPAASTSELMVLAPLSVGTPVVRTFTVVTPNGMLETYSVPVFSRRTPVAAL